MTDIEAAVLFTRHDDDCPLCGGEDQVQISVVRRRVVGGPAVADPVAAVITCPLLPRLAQLFRSPVSRPRGGAA
jgi:hypothetical protein